MGPDSSERALSGDRVEFANWTQMLTRLVDAPILVIGARFAGRTACRVVRDGDDFAR